MCDGKKTWDPDGKKAGSFPAGRVCCPALLSLAWSRKSYVPPPTRPHLGTSMSPDRTSASPQASPMVGSIEDGSGVPGLGGLRYSIFAHAAPAGSSC